MSSKLLIIHQSALSYNKLKMTQTSQAHTISHCDSLFYCYFVGKEGGNVFEASKFLLLLIFSWFNFIVICWINGNIWRQIYPSSQHLLAGNSFTSFLKKKIRIKSRQSLEHFFHFLLESHKACYFQAKYLFSLNNCARNTTLLQCFLHFFPMLIHRRAFSNSQIS